MISRAGLPMRQDFDTVPEFPARSNSVTQARCHYAATPAADFRPGHDPDQRKRQLKRFFSAVAESGMLCA